MATKKAAAKTPNESDYVTPEGAEWTDPCPGSVGSATNLVDVENQVKENENAFRENRKANALAIPCPFCGNYHLEMQKPVADLVGGEVVKDFIDNSTPPPVEEPPVDEAALAAAVNLHNPQNEVPVEEDEDTGIEDILNDKSNSDS
jgi:hypothetical protein